jgi:hypothetical protein
MCSRIAWLQSLCRNLAELAVLHAKVNSGVLFMLCTRCGSANSRLDIAIIDVCPKVWSRAEAIQVAESLAGHEMLVLGHGRGTAVVDLLSLV